MSLAPRGCAAQTASTAPGGRRTGRGHAVEVAQRDDPPASIKDDVGDAHVERIVADAIVPRHQHEHALVGAQLTSSSSPSASVARPTRSRQSPGEHRASRLLRRVAQRVPTPSIAVASASWPKSMSSSGLISLIPRSSKSRARATREGRSACTGMRSCAQPWR